MASPAAPREAWTPTSWRSKAIKQDVAYPAGGGATKPVMELAEVTKKLRTLPGLVSAVEIERLKQQLVDVANGKAFLLQGGDCAELFSYCQSSALDSKLKLLLLMSLIIIWGARLPVVRVGRIAGQYAKPRSKPTEMVDGKEVLSFRGDNVNGFGIDERSPDPERLLGAYFHSAATLNYIRSQLSSGFADLHHSLDWSSAHVRSPALQSAFESIIDNLTDALDFIRVVGADPSASASAANGMGAAMGSLNSVDFWASHEGLLLEYEEALTRHLEIPGSRKGASTPTTLPTSPVGTPGPHGRSSFLSRESSTDGAAGYGLGRRAVAGKKVEAEKGWYNLSGHFIWIGDRTRNLEGAHIEYFRGIRNPIGIKVGPTMAPDELVRLLDIVDPDHESGRVTLICRYGADKVEDCLPKHISAVQSTQHTVVFACDPMHGNTRTAAGGEVKTRHMADIVVELSRSIRIHAAHGSRLGGVHLELTGDVDEDGFSVTECVGGSMELEDKDLSRNYQTYCDPRLNYEQSLDVAFLISRYFQNERRGRKTEDTILTNLSLKSPIGQASQAAKQEAAEGAKA